MGDGGEFEADAAAWSECGALAENMGYNSALGFSRAHASKRSRKSTPAFTLHEEPTQKKKKK